MKRIYNGVEVNFTNETDYNQSNVVYLITFPNGKYYVGQTTGKLGKRISEHCCKHGMVVGKALQKYKKAIISIIFNGTEATDLDHFEIMYIRLFGSMNKEYGYNMSTGGNKNKILSTETRQKISTANKGKRLSEETKLKMKLSNSNKNTGLVRTDEQNKHSSDAHSIYLYSVVSLDTGWLTRTEIADMIGVEKTRVSTAARNKCKCNGYIISRKKINQ